MQESISNVILLEIGKQKMMKLSLLTTDQKYNFRRASLFLGRLINKAKNNILAKTDILIFPTEYKLETFGRVIIEAMEYGIPVIANNIATIPSIIDHGVSGFVLSKNTPKEILNYILEMNDKYRRSQMSKMARKFFLEKYTLEKYAQNYRNNKKTINN